MSKLREAAKAALAAYETYRDVDDIDGLDDAIDRLRAALAQPETDAGVSWDGHNVRGDADSIAEVRRLIDFEQARQGAKPATGDDLRVYDAIAANYVNAEPEPVVIGPEWTPCVKLPITVHVREQRPGEQHVSTREGITPVKPDDLIMRGVAGEEYPIGRELFNRTYRIGAHPPRDEWRLASEPPEDGRRVLIWVAKSGGETFRPAYCPAGGWTSVFDGETLVAWRDINPPTEGAK